MMCGLFALRVCLIVLLVLTVFKNSLWAFALVVIILALIPLVLALNSIEIDE